MAVSPLKSKNVVLVTSTNLACNPRCLKELKLLVKLDAVVTVVAFNLNNWTNVQEEKIRNEFTQVNFIYLKATKKDNLLSWLIASCTQKLSNFFLFFLPKNIFLNAMASSKINWMLFRFFRNTSIDANLVIAHNPGAFYAAAFFAKKKNARLAIDVEDFHPGETNGTSDLSNKVSAVMANILPKCTYTSYASPLIKEHTQQLVKINLQNAIVINNSFSQEEFNLPQQHNTSNVVKMVWFSQYIDYGRGLEILLPILDIFSKNISITLIGNCRQIFYDNEIANRKYITSIASMPHQGLQLELSKYDIGLAFEDASTNFNRNICLTNKIWSYFQAGLFILATNTDAQKVFIHQHSNHGLTTSTNTHDLEKNISFLINEINQIKSKKSLRFSQAQKFSWENESLQLIKMWEKVLG